MATDFSHNSTAPSCNDWQTVLVQLQTILAPDLFQLVDKAAQWSEFVRTSFSQNLEASCAALQWQAHQSDNAIASTLEQRFSAFNPVSDESEDTVMRRLRLFRRAHSAAVAVLELTDRLPIESTSLRISLLADCLIKAAYRFSYEQHAQRFGQPLGHSQRPSQLLIIAMGKLGGLELNFSSDIDLIFLYPEDGETSGTTRTTDNARFFRRVGTQLIKLLDEVTQDGFVFRVDMRLRPYGDSGALVMSLAQAEEYYQEQGREWERFAMIRSRVLTGEPADQKILDDIIRPFSFRRYIDYGVIDSIRSMKEMIQREVRRKGLTDNIKLGAGGIREVEFIVQSMQLIQGGRDKRLREKSVLKVLPLLVEAKLLPAKTQANLSQAYRFLRRLEHCIQELAERQTQQLPVDPNERAAISHAMGFDNWSQLIDQLKIHQHKTNDHFNALFGEERRQALTQDDFYRALAEGHIDVEQLTAELIERSQRQLAQDVAAQFIQQVDGFVTESSVLNLSSRGSKRLKAFFPALLASCLATKSPDVTLSRLLKVLRAILKRTAYLELLSENPPILQHLVDLAGQSEWVVQRLSEFPVLFDELLYPNSLYEPLQTADLKSELQQILLRIDANDEEELLDALRAFKQINELRVAAALLAERLSISQVSQYLTQQAEVILQAAVEQCWRLLVLKHGAPEGLSGQAHDCGFAIIGYGKLGGVELGFGSDLDLVFLFDQSMELATTGERSINNSRFYTRLAQKLIHFLSTRTNSGLLYEVDMRLRPSGSSGLLVSHIDAYRDYQMESAWTWEHQALIRARFVAGDKKLSPAFEQIRLRTLRKNRELPQLKKDVVEMRQKMRGQLEKVIMGKVDLKQATGGLVDIEFLAQYLVLAYQGDLPIPHGTVKCLQFIERQQMLSNQDAMTLIKHYRDIRNKLNAMALMEQGRHLPETEMAEKLSEVNAIWQRVLGQSN